MEHSLRYIISIIFVFAINQCLNAQISINGSVHKEDVLVYGNYSSSDYGADIYNMRTCNDPCICKTDSDVYYLLFSHPERGIRGEKVISYAKFFLSGDKGKAIQAIQDIITAISNLKKNESITIKDFKQKKYIFAGKKIGRTFYLIDPKVELQNVYGAKYRGARYVGQISFLKEAIEKSDLWKQ